MLASTITTKTFFFSLVVVVVSILLLISSIEDSFFFVDCKRSHLRRHPSHNNRYRRHPYHYHHHSNNNNKYRRSRINHHNTHMSNTSPLKDKFTVYVGTWSNKLYILNLETHTGTLTLQSTVDVGMRPSYITFDPTNTHLYAVNEVEEYRGRNHSGAVVSMDLRTKRVVSAVPSLGADPCFIMVDKTGKHLLVANYNDDSSTKDPSASTVAVFSVHPSNATIEQHPTDFIKFEGKGPNRERQNAAHPHHFVLDPTNRFAFMVDLGGDRIYQYLFNPDGSKTLTPNPHAPFVTSRPGSGPRHIAFHPSLRYAYVAHELDSTMTVFNFDSERGTLEPVQVISMLPDNTDPSKCSGAEVQVSPDGRFVYGNNRGESDTFAIYRVDPTNGKLTLVKHEETGGHFPRHFMMDKTGQILLVANQLSNNIRVFRRDIESGLLKKIGGIDGIKIPTCIAML